uniref:Uncharacterized protein n=1 Tax=Rhabditophanes sp. KR3021 TaxID=114890 RepID=A0AC35UC96_9BILA
MVFTSKKADSSIETISKMATSPISNAAIVAPKKRGRPRTKSISRSDSVGRNKSLTTKTPRSKSGSRLALAKAKKIAEVRQSSRRRPRLATKDIIKDVETSLVTLDLLPQDVSIETKRKLVDRPLVDEKQKEELKKAELKKEPKFTVGISFVEIMFMIIFGTILFALLCAGYIYTQCGDGLDCWITTTHETIQSIQDYNYKKLFRFFNTQ